VSEDEPKSALIPDLPSTIHILQEAKDCISNTLLMPALNQQNLQLALKDEKTRAYLQQLGCDLDSLDQMSQSWGGHTLREIYLVHLKDAANYLRTLADRLDPSGSPHEKSSNVSKTPQREATVEA
jgi:hypothetical protein